MILFIEKITDTKASVSSIHYQPEILDVVERSNGIEVVSVLEPIVQEGKTPILYINPQTKEQWYEYIDRPLTEKEEIEKLKQENVTMQDTINFLLGL